MPLFRLLRYRGWVRWASSAGWAGPAVWRGGRAWRLPGSRPWRLPRVSWCLHCRRLPDTLQVVRCIPGQSDRENAENLQGVGERAVRRRRVKLRAGVASRRAVSRAVWPARPGRVRSGRSGRARGLPGRAVSPDLGSRIRTTRKATLADSATTRLEAARLPPMLFRTLPLRQQSVSTALTLRPHRQSRRVSGPVCLRRAGKATFCAGRPY